MIRSSTSKTINYLFWLYPFKIYILYAYAIHQSSYDFRCTLERFLLSFSSSWFVSLRWCSLVVFFWLLLLLLLLRCCLQYMEAILLNVRSSVRIMILCWLLMTNAITITFVIFSYTFISISFLETKRRERKKKRHTAKMLKKREGKCK